MKLDVLAFGAHPDDVEISAGGTIARLVSEGKEVGIVDLTRGELGSRGSAEIRDAEAKASASILGVRVRENLEMADGFFLNDKAHQLRIIEQVRRFKPEIVICNSVSDRHPDHGKGAKLTADACFLSGLVKIESLWDGKSQDAWRPRLILHYIQDHYLAPDIVWDVSDFFETKMDAVKAFRSQFYDPNSEEVETPISGKGFFDLLKARAVSFGRPAGMELAEGFNVARTLGVKDLFSLL